MADSTRPTSNELDHPEVLSKERLLEILRERSMHPQGLADLDKGDLVQLFYKYVTPLPQRLHQLRRAKRGTPCGRESGTSKTKTSTIIRLTKRKSEEATDVTGSKIARTEHSTIIKINKKPASLELINKGINSVTINATSPTLDSGTGHEGNSLNKNAKPKVVKLNRKTLGLNLNKSVEQPPVKDKLGSSINGRVQKAINASLTSSESGCDDTDKDIEMNNPKKKFEKVAVTWP